MTDKQLRLRPAAVAGLFYSEDAAMLHAEVQGYLSRVHPDSGATPKAVIVPHAGYRYSAGVAALAYAELAKGRGQIKRVVLMGPAHQTAVAGFALSGAEAFETPLGLSVVDTKAVRQLAEHPDARIMDLAHAQEHAIEVQLPFIKEALGNVEIIPILVGDSTFEAVAEILEIVWGGAETVIVISSDLSHFLSYEDCVTLDTVTTHAIETLSADKINRPQACGRMPIGGLLQCAKQRSMRVKTLDVKNSGDTAGPNGQVVGYGSWSFAETSDAPPVTETHGKELLDIARAAIAHGIDNNGQPQNIDLASVPPELADYGSAFVTLISNNKLCGCAGSIRATQSLAVDVANNACNAAFRDNRFGPLPAENFEDLQLTVTVLGPLDPIEFKNELDLIGIIEPGVDGLVIADKGRRALFLPQVWLDLPDPIVFLAQLKLKAALDISESGTMQAWRFRVTEVHSDAAAHAEITAEREDEK